jgi:hypothetical protein
VPEVDVGQGAPQVIEHGRVGRLRTEHPQGLHHGSRDGARTGESSGGHMAERDPQPEDRESTRGPSVRYVAEAGTWVDSPRRAVLRGDLHATTRSTRDRRRDHVDRRRHQPEARTSSWPVRVRARVVGSRRRGGGDGARRRSRGGLPEVWKSDGIQTASGLRRRTRSRILGVVRGASMRRKNSGKILRRRTGDFPWGVQLLVSKMLTSESIAWMPWGSLHAAFCQK